MINYLWHTEGGIAAQPFPLPHGLRAHNNYADCSTFIAGGTRERECFAFASILASPVGISWTRFPDLGRLHGPG